MIARFWHGRVPTSRAETYRDFLNRRAVPDYRAVPGNLSVHILERADGEITHFVTMSFWQDLDAVRAYAGSDFNAAKYYPEDRDFLLEFEPNVVHYDVVGVG